jgi:uncharacterized surface anchored protein
MITLVLGFSVIMFQTAYADDAATPVVTTTSDGTSDAGGSQDAGDTGTADSETTDESGDGATMDADNGNSTTDPLTDASPTADEPATDDATEPPPAASPSAGEAATDDAAPGASPAPNDLRAADQTTGTVVAVAQDDGGNPINYACFQIYRDNGGSLGPFITNRCDSVDGTTDGSATFTDVPTGNLVLLLSQTGPSGQFVNGEQVQFTLAADETKTVVVTAERGGRTVEIDKVDENGDPLGGACFNIHRDAGGGQLGDFVTSNCDGPIPNGPFDGVTYVPGLLPGDYVAYEGRVPDGYVRGANTPFTVPESGDVPPVTVSNNPLQAGGNLIIHKVDEQSQPLAGACFAVYSDAGGEVLGTYITQVCDTNRDSNGTMTVTGLNVGDYLLQEFHSPNGYINGGITSFSIVADEPTELTIPNTPGGATLTIHKVDADTNDVLTGSCWVVYHDNGSGQITPGSSLEGRCDSSDGSDNGITPFTGLAPGDYILYERVAPDGYTPSSNILFSIDEDQHDIELTVPNTKG